MSTITGQIAQVGKRRRPQSFTVDVCDACAKELVSTTRAVDIGRCADCANYFCRCWLEHGTYLGDPATYLFCNRDALGGCWDGDDDE